MLNRIDTSTVTHSHLNGFAQVIERIGLAIMGALCGLFVAALVAEANIEAINSIGVLFSASSTALSASILELTFLHCLPVPPAAPYHTAVRVRRRFRLRWRAAPAHSSPPLQRSCRYV